MFVVAVTVAVAVCCCCSCERRNNDDNEGSRDWSLFALIVVASHVLNPIQTRIGRLLVILS